MKNLKIQIIGTTGSGKSTLLILISKFLKNLGFEVEICDDQIIDENFMDKKVQSLKDKVKIEILTQQIKIDERA